MTKKKSPTIEGFITDENGIPRIRVDKSGDMHNHWVERVKDDNGDSHDVYKLGLLNQKDPLQEYDWSVNPPQKPLSVESPPVAVVASRTSTESKLESEKRTTWPKLPAPLWFGTR